MQQESELFFILRWFPLWLIRCGQCCLHGMMYPELPFLDLSALVLGEVRQAFNLGSLIALFLVCVGIYVVNRKDKASVN